MLERSGGGHVGFVVGRLQSGLILILGGNQGDAVNIKAFPLARAVGFRWPAGEPGVGAALPVVSYDVTTSTREN